MNNFRASLQSGNGLRGAEPVLAHKQPRSVGGEGLESIPVPRDAQRTADHRDDDRHRLLAQTATISYRGTTLTVELVNLSGGGAMIRGDISPNMWERLDLTLGEHGTLECAVRWIRGDRVGLEFAHETQIQCDAAVRDEMLLAVIRTSFPDIMAAVPSEVIAEPEAPTPPLDAARRGEPRHPMIWSGHIHYAHESMPVRLRNVSPHGALIESPLAYPEGAEVYLDLGEAGSLFATVSWSRGDQVGLAFAQTFDIARLAQARPEIAPRRWATPHYLRDDQGDGSPWSSGWGRLSVDELRTSLEGFLKR